jgi:type 1 fimbria pilin
MRKLLLGASAALAVLAVSASASAATFAISADHLATTDYTVTLGGTVFGVSPPYANVYESPDILTVSIDGGPNVDLMVFCVDIFHLFNSNTPPVTYDSNLVTTNSDGAASGTGHALSHVVSGQIAFLAHLALTDHTAEQLAGIQGAIWQTEYGDLTISGGSGQIGHYVDLANAWGAANANYQGYANGIVHEGAIYQAFIPSAPEPTTWALMIGGFGVAGAMLRRRRAAAA